MDAKKTNRFSAKNWLKNYRHIQVNMAQESKINQYVCGDLVRQEKSERYTVILLADGIGSGIKAQIAAQMASENLLEMLRLGFSLRTAVGNVVKTMHKARSEDIPFAAFNVAYILPDNSVTLFSYEAPLPILIERKYVYAPKPRYIDIHDEVIAECRFQLREGTSILLMSDGITQAGLGRTSASFSTGFVPHFSSRRFGGPRSEIISWSYPGIIQFIKERLFEQVRPELLPQLLLTKATEVSGGYLEDDATALVLTSRESQIANLLTGPPSDPALDKQLIDEFMQLRGYKFICGSTTADIVARHTGQEVKLNGVPGAFDQPPQYELAGIDLATEGAVVLNQLYNILDEDVEHYNPDSCVSELARLLRSVDVVNIWVGTSLNPGHKSIEFKQLGILSRQRIVELVVGKLKKMNKLVIIRML